MTRIPIIDSHTGGEPTRVVLSPLGAPIFYRLWANVLTTPHLRAYPHLIAHRSRRPISSWQSQILSRHFAPRHTSPNGAADYSPGSAEPRRGDPGSCAPSPGSKPSVYPRTAPTSSVFHQSRRTLAPQHPFVSKTHFTAAKHR